VRFGIFLWHHSHRHGQSCWSRSNSCDYIEEHWDEEEVGRHVVCVLCGVCACALETNETMTCSQLMLHVMPGVYILKWHQQMCGQGKLKSWIRE
jgi:hypothetical protein